MTKKKVLITATVLSHIAQFHRPLGDILHAKGFEVHVAGKDNLALKNGLKIDWADKIYDVPFSRSPKSLDNVKAYQTLKNIIDCEGYSHIHCNTPMGGIVTRLAARKARRNGSIVIYTAHGFHFHKKSNKLSWLVFYPIEKYFAKYTDILVTINHEDYALASRKFNCKIRYMHGVGVDASRYVPISSEVERINICTELGIDPNHKVILSIGELLPNKNHMMIIKAMKTIVKEIPESLLIIAGNGPMRDELEGFIKSNGLSENIRLIGYCTELEKYQKIALLLAACSYREGLPLNLVEAMLAKNPIVASHNRGHDELIEHGTRGFLVESEDAKEMAK
ncbi:MAG: glycosyltransferase, partial [Muribaculaceae bacterium]|nr:glycosyltransferase [Muribaculaceae bacterium]